MLAMTYEYLFIAVVAGVLSAFVLARAGVAAFSDRVFDAHQISCLLTANTLEMTDDRVHAALRALIAGLSAKILYPDC